jgi:hypothetical protein
MRYSIEKGRLVGGSCPTPGDLKRLKREGFHAIISLLEEENQYAYSPAEAGRDFLWRNVPMRDHATPTLDQLMGFYDTLGELPESARVYVHCLAGIGRTGTVAASYLALRGWDLEEAYRQVNAWTGGYFLLEIGSRKEEVDLLISRFLESFSGSPSRPRV